MRFTESRTVLLSSGCTVRRSMISTSPPDSASASAATTDSGATPVRWFGTMSPSLSNQKSVIWLSTTPLPGIGSFMTTSNADRRSVVTIRILSSPTA